MGPLRATWPFLLALGLGLASACSSSSRRPSATSPELPPPTTIRLYALANVAGALEPCGCQKDMLGGIDHAARIIMDERSQIDQTVLVATGPTFYLYPTSAPEARQQDAWKAEALAWSLNDIGLVAWTPGANDFNRSVAIQRLSQLSAAPWVAANLSRLGGRDSVVVQRGTIRVGITGVSLPQAPDQPLSVPTGSDPAAALRRGLDGLREQGADLLIALLALPRGEALRVVERVSGFHLAVLGKPYQVGDGNDAAAPPVLVGGTLVIQPANLLQTLAVVDFKLVGDDRELKDAGGLVDAARRELLDRHIARLKRRIVAAEASGASPADVAARRSDLDRLRVERAALDPEPTTIGGSWFRYSLREVREIVGVDDAVSQRILDYYRQVNEHNQVALADDVPLPVADGKSRYAGGHTCVPCHEAADAFWKQTRHASAYATLVERYTNYNLECVGCHVTGYAEPGGSTAVHVEGLQNVQCEVCHGPGSLHNARPGDPSLIILTPDKSLCASRCHKPPHVPDDWSVDDAWQQQIGPGHGQPLPTPEPSPNDDEPLSPEDALKLLVE